jgi:predicted dehydrogenase
MAKDKVTIGFIGTGGIARSHAYSLNSLKFYYDDAPEIELQAACSATKESRDKFASKYGFKASASLDEFIKNDEIDTVFILGPNKVHFSHLKAALGMPAVKRVYLEKPVCSGSEEAKAMKKLVESRSDIKIQVGFQFVFASAIRDMIRLWQAGRLGEPVHFDLKYYHSDYQKKEYRTKRVTRLTAAPDGGAMADLGSHSVSLLVALLGEKLEIVSALQGGHYEDVIRESDLFSLISLYDKASGAVGTISASRISSGTGDHFSIELYAEKGALRFSSAQPDSYEVFTEESSVWSRYFTGSDFKPYTGFPSVHVPAGWLRSMIHAQYVFLNGNHDHDFVPGIDHGLAVQRLVTETAIHLKVFREFRDKL